MEHPSKGGKECRTGDGKLDRVVVDKEKNRTAVTDVVILGDCTIRQKTDQLE